MKYLGNRNAAINEALANGVCLRRIGQLSPSVEQVPGLRPLAALDGNLLSDGVFACMGLQEEDDFPGIVKFCTPSRQIKRATWRLIGWAICCSGCMF